MYAKLRIELDSSQISYQQSSNLQGVLMEQIDTDYAQELHQYSLNPYSQYVVKEKDKKICALIYCDPAKQETVKEFVTGVNRGLPLYKRMVPELSAQPLPRNAMGKLLR